MSNKNLSQSITEAWKTAVETGQRLDENKQKREQEVSKIFDSARTDVIQHVLENDHGFYRPDVDPFFSAVDGGMLRRQRLDEQQAPMPIEGDGGGASGRESEEVRKEVEKRMAAAKKREEEEIARRDRQAQTGINPDSERYRGRENEAGLRGDPDFDPTAPGAQRDVRAAQVRDALAGVRGPKYGDRLSSENTGTRGSIQVSGIGSAGGSVGDAPGSRREDLTGEDKEAYERVVAARLERDKDKIAVGDMDADGRMTAQGRRNRDASIARAEARRDVVRSKARAREDKAAAEADARTERLAARREARKAGKTPVTGRSRAATSGGAVTQPPEGSQTEIAPNQPPTTTTPDTDTGVRRDRPSHIAFKEPPPGTASIFIYSDGGLIPLGERVKITPPSSMSEEEQERLYGGVVEKPGGVGSRGLR